MAPPVPDEVLRLVEAFVFASAQPVTAAALRPLVPEPLDPAAVLDALRPAGRSAPRRTWRAHSARCWRRGGGFPGPAWRCWRWWRCTSRSTRAEIEAVRGAVLAQATMDALIEAGLIQPAGRKEAPGRPTLWVAAPVFLERFGLRSLRDLPGQQAAGLLDPSAVMAGSATGQAP